MKKLYLAVFASVLLTGSAVADPTTVEPAPEPQFLPLPGGGTLFNWRARGNNWGSYAGVKATGVIKSTGSTLGLIEVIGGIYATTPDNIVFGAEVSAGGWAGADSYGPYSSPYGSSGWTAGAEARLGVLADPNVLVYGSVGVQTLDGTSNFGKIGAGLEFALDDTFSLGIEYDYMKLFDGSGISANSLGASFVTNF